MGMGTDLSLSPLVRHGVLVVVRPEQRQSERLRHRLRARCQPNDHILEPPQLLGDLLGRPGS